jgi:putative glutathione S-transferase
VISLSVLDPVRDERGWAFGEGPGHGPDPVNGFTFLSEAYRATDPRYEGRINVPVLWDRVRGRIVSNESADIIRMLDTEFAALAEPTPSLCPPELRDEIDAVNGHVYERLNNGVYRAGFSRSQGAYERAALGVSDELDALEGRLRSRRYLVGDRLTEADVRLFTTLIRFDTVYHTHFACNRRRVVDYPGLWGFTRDLYSRPEIGPTVDFDHICRHYYLTHPHINPRRIVPIGPILDLEAPHGRERLP